VSAEKYEPPHAAVHATPKKQGESSEVVHWLESGGHTGFGSSMRQAPVQAERIAAQAPPQRFFTSSDAFVQSTPRKQSEHCVSMAHAFTTTPFENWMHLRQLSDNVRPPTPPLELPPVPEAPPEPQAPPPHPPAPAAAPALPATLVPPLAEPLFPLAEPPEPACPASPLDVPAWALAPAAPAEVPSAPPHELKPRTTVQSALTARFRITILSSGRTTDSPRDLRRPSPR
jgi:hypothetical protein